MTVRVTFLKPCEYVSCGRSMFEPRPEDEEAIESYMHASDFPACRVLLSHASLLYGPDDLYMYMSSRM